MIEYMEKLKKYPLLVRVGLVILAIAFIAGMIELFINIKPHNNEEDRNINSGYYDYFDVM